MRSNLFMVLACLAAFTAMTATFAWGDPGVGAPGLFMLGLALLALVHGVVIAGLVYCTAHLVHDSVAARLAGRR